MRTVIFCLFLLTSLFAGAQQTVFSVMKGPVRLGDQEYERGEYREAIQFYKSSLNKDPKNISVLSKLAQCYYFIKDHKGCIDTYDVIAKQGGQLNRNEMFRYAESLSAMEDYAGAIAWYKKCLVHDRGNEMIARKIWALSNIQFMQEDSAHYHVRLLNGVNTPAAELGVALSSEGLIFTSNRKGGRPLDIANDDVSGPFFELYINEFKIDSLSSERTLLGKPVRFARSLDVQFNAGPVAFFDHGRKMVFVASASKAGPDGFRALGLYFAESQGAKWRMTSSWQHNSAAYSITDVTINEDGSKLYFSSNMSGGLGGKDIYVSTFSDGNWTKPVNVGDGINTSSDEVFPYLHRNGTLYFSSNGLPGIGGLDMFRSVIKRSGYSEPENVGYPLNSHGDDFGLVFDSLATHGYFSSNRINGGTDDDIYEFTMDMQTYPFQMNGFLRTKDHAWSDSLEITSWANVKLSLVDTWQDSHVYETVTAVDGAFSLTVPYFSRYHILVTDEKGKVYKVSLELEKYRTETNRYEIVVVKELFAELKEP